MSKSREVKNGIDKKQLDQRSSTSQEFDLLNTRLEMIQAVYSCKHRWCKERGSTCVEEGNHSKWPSEENWDYFL